MKLPSHKTKIVCTIGPSSRKPSMIEDMINAGMNVARLNFSHGDHAQHAADILHIRQAAKKLNRIVGILIDLPGVKMRIGKIPNGPVNLKNGETVTLTTRVIDGNDKIIPVQYSQLPRSVSKGSVIFLNDGFIQLKVIRVYQTEITCRIVIGGAISSHKGINLPGAKISVNAVTKQDLQHIDFGLRHGVHTFGISFVEKASDIKRVRAFARKKGNHVNLVAKIERREALDHLDEILEAADAVMIARGDLGIEIPTEQVPMIQKKVIRKANLLGKPVITATQMLGSMTKNIRPTRAEVNDVANAILDGTDAVMLSEETAAGEYPVQAIEMMVKVAVSAEHFACTEQLSDEIREQIRGQMTAAGLMIPDAISLNAVRAAVKLNAKYIITPTSSGSTARRISRFKPQCWILSFTHKLEVCHFLTFSYGMYPFYKQKKASMPVAELRRKLHSLKLVKKGDVIIIAERRISEKSGETDSMGVMTI